jgi:dGTPase
MSANSDITREREQLLLASYAMHSADSTGRQHAEPGHPYRGPYQRDRDRIVHSAAFRRLSHKTQVFTGEMGDYHRSRLTHTLEVSSIARTIARAMRLNEDLVEALALAHDLGHPPFGHSGEDVLNACLSDVGGFNHNEQALRICELLESGYPDFPGLNLTHEVLEGQRHRAHKGPPNGNTEGKPNTQESPLLEVQAVDAADSIAYDTHDADDSLELGLLYLDQLLELRLWQEAREQVEPRGKLNERQLRRAIVHKIIDWQVSDVIAQSRRNLSEQDIQSVCDVRKANVVIQPSAALAEKKHELEEFLFEKVYRHPGVLAKRREAQQVLLESFKTLLANPDLLPAKFRRLAQREGLPRATGDYLAGMTDRFALQEHKKLIGPTANE